LKHFIENCGRTAADEDRVTIHRLYKKSPAPYRRPPTTYRLTTVPHDWHTIVRYGPSRSSKVIDYRGDRGDINITWKPVCDFYNWFIAT